MAANKKQVSYHMRIADCIPDELLFEILLRLPAQDIYFEARLVCRKWYHMIRTKYFIHKHFEHADYGLLYVDEYVNLVFTSLREDRGGTIDTYRLNYNNMLRRPILSSWNGLTLEYETTGKEFICIVTNILTGKSFCPPPCHYYCGNYGGIGYDATSTTYKVVVPFMEKSEKYGCAILTVGVDKSWRIVPIGHLSLRGKRTLWNNPITTEGFMHWKESFDTQVVTLNLETEIITETTPPKVEKKNTQTWYLSTGWDLTLFYRHGRWAWEVFEMKPEIGEWRKFADICLEGQKGRINRFGFGYAYIEPLGWLKYPEVLALRVKSNVIIFYNLVTCEISAKTLSIAYNTPITLHKNSLVWLDGP